jgi:excisionase family DNA binding protein
MNPTDDRWTEGNEGEGGRRQAPVGEGRPQGRALAARLPRSPNRSFTCARCAERIDPGTLMSMPDVALRLGTSVRHVRRLVAERRIPIVKVGRFVRFEAHELEHWIDDHRVGETNGRPRGGRSSGRGDRRAS